MASNETDQDDNTEYAVGYGRPPKHTRWKKGHSGNPAGRAKGARGLKTDLRAELISRMEISMNGKRVTGTKQQLMLRTLTARAAAGDVRATRILIDLVLQVFGPEDEHAGPKGLSRSDQQILDQLIGRRSGLDEPGQRPMIKSDDATAEAASPPPSYDAEPKPDQETDQ